MHDDSRAVIRVNMVSETFYITIKFNQKIINYETMTIN